MGDSSSEETNVGYNDDELYGALYDGIYTDEQPYANSTNLPNIKPNEMETASLNILYIIIASVAAALTIILTIGYICHKKKISAREVKAGWLQGDVNRFGEQKNSLST